MTEVATNKTESRSTFDSRRSTRRTSAGIRATWLGIASAWPSIVAISTVAFLLVPASLVQAAPCDPPLPGETQLLLDEVEGNDDQSNANFILGFGTGVGDNPAVDVCGADGGDVDYFSFDLEAGDVIGAVGGVSQGKLTLLSPDGTERVAVVGNVNAITRLPPNTQFPEGDMAFPPDVAEVAGEYALRIEGTSFPPGNTEGDYRLQVRVFRPGLEAQPSGTRQTIYLDFDGASIAPGDFPNDCPTGCGSSLTFEPLSASLADWGLPTGPGTTELDEIIDGVVARVNENIREDVLSSDLNPGFEIDIVNSRDLATPPTGPHVIHIIIGAIPGDNNLLFGAPAWAEFHDPGNFSSSKTGVVFTNRLAGSGMFAFNNIALAPGASFTELVAVGLGNIASHEMGHLFGVFHTRFDPSIESDDPGMPPVAIRNLMDANPNFVPETLSSIVGAGSNGIFGDSDDEDIDFSSDAYSLDEMYNSASENGVQHALAKIAFAAACPDCDQDGVANSVDNCTMVANPNQVDSDDDGYGNQCDADIALDGTMMNDGFVLGDDIIAIFACFGAAPPLTSECENADIKGNVGTGELDGFVLGNDVIEAFDNFGNPPGPSGLSCRGLPLCPAP